MKKLLLPLFYLVIALLVLQVIQVAVLKTSWPSAFFIATLIKSLQVFIALGYLLIPIFFLLLQKLIRQTKKAWIAASLLFIGLMAGLEGLCTHWLYNPATIPDSLKQECRYYYDIYERDVVQYKKEACTYDPALFYSFIPGARFRFGNFEFNNGYAVNSQRFRDDEASLQRPRILSLGDSFGMGWGVEQDSTYAQVLEKITGQKVLNTAVSSYGTVRELISLNRVDTSAFEYLLIQYCSNDIKENEEYVNNNFRLKVSAREKYDQSVATLSYTLTYYPGKRLSYLLWTRLKRYLPRFGKKTTTTGSEKDMMDPGIHARLFLDVLRKAPIDFSKHKVIVFKLAGSDLLQLGEERAMGSLIRQSPYKEKFGNNIRILDLSKVLTSADHYILDRHLNARGHRRVARELADLMKSF